MAPRTGPAEKGTPILSQRNVQRVFRGDRPVWRGASQTPLFHRKPTFIALPNVGELYFVY